MMSSPMNIWNSFFNRPVMRFSLRRVPTKRRSYLTIMKTSSRHRHQPARHRGRSETRCCGEGSTTRDEYHYHDRLQCAEGRRDPARELVPCKALQRPKDDRGSTAFPVTGRQALSPLTEDR